MIIIAHFNKIIIIEVFKFSFSSSLSIRFSKYLNDNLLYFKNSELGVLLLAIMLKFKFSFSLTVMLALAVSSIQTVLPLISVQSTFEFNLKSSSTVMPLSIEKIIKSDLSYFFWEERK